MLSNLPVFRSTKRQIHLRPSFAARVTESVDNKTISKWARALRYVAYCEVPSTRLKAFMKEAGGINACAARFARYYGRGGRSE